jgi:MFS family permease
MIIASNALLPFKEKLFRKLWITSFASNVGTWMQNIGVSWLAATLSASPLIISLIQTASSLPSFLFSYLAGVYADRKDRRIMLMLTQSVLFFLLIVLIFLTWIHLLTIYMLLLFTFLIGICTAFSTPTWDSIIPEIISKENLKPAIALEGVNFNLSRVVGPALGGILLTEGGIISVFAFYAVTALAPVIGLYGWKNTQVFPATVLSFRENFVEGLKAISKATQFKLLMIRTISFVGFVSTIFALLPEIAKYEWGRTSGQFTVLWIFLGAGALSGSFLFGIINKIMTASHIIFFCCELVAVCIFLLAITRNIYLINTVMFVIGIGWINTNATLNVLAQQLAPTEHRARYLSINTMVFQGSLALSSAGWGYLSNQITSLTAMKIAALSMAIFSLILVFFLPMTETFSVEPTIVHNKIAPVQ